MKYVIAFILTFFSLSCFSAKLPELPKELVANSNVKPIAQKGKAPLKKNVTDPVIDQYLSCTATRQSDLVGLPVRTYVIQLSKNSAYWLESRKTFPLRIEEYEYLIGDAKEGFVINRRDGQVDYLEDGKVLHGVCKLVDKPATAI